MAENSSSLTHHAPLPSREGTGKIQYVATIGFFDGVHRGHQCLVQQVRDEALRQNAPSMLITFDRHPRSVFAPDCAPPLLTSATEKMELLRAEGVDEIYVLPFNRQTAALTAREFMATVLRERLGIKTLVIGYDHHFGRPQGEGFEDYRTYGQELGIKVVLAHELEGEHVSSTSIRRALEQGDVCKATHLLGRPYTWTGRVVHGHAIGRKLGFPTANLEAIDPLKLLPASGAYAIKVGDTKGMLNIGHRPTINNGDEMTVEVNLFDFDGNLYGQELTLSFIARLREERRFDNETQLAQQLKADREQALRIL